MKEIKIRKANLSEAEEIANLIVHTWKISYSNILPQNILAQRKPDGSIQHIKNDIKSPDKIVLVAVNENNEMIGMVSGGPCREEVDGYDGELYATYVLPEHQGKGIGKLLFIKFCEWLKENKLHSLKLWTLKKNIPTRKFYERMGGKIIQEKQIEINGEKFAAVSYGWAIIDW